MLTDPQCDNLDTSVHTGSPGVFYYPDPALPSPLRVWYHHPNALPNDAPIVIVMHGTRRDADMYCASWQPSAERLQCLLLCPEFDAATFPGSSYHLGNVVTANGDVVSQEHWAFLVIERLFDWVKRHIGNTSQHYAIYGHSAGAQFVHRLALFLPGARFHSAVAANAGWYTLPTSRRSVFPYSLSGAPARAGLLAQAFSRRLHILLGERDTDVNDPHLRQSARANRQGAHRLARGHTFYQTARDEAERMRVDLQWTLQVVPGAGHADGQMLPAAIAALFGSNE